MKRVILLIIIICLLMHGCSAPAHPPYLGTEILCTILIGPLPVGFKAIALINLPLVFLLETLGLPFAVIELLID